jgi:hypothetical protein
MMSRSRSRFVSMDAFHAEGDDASYFQNRETRACVSEMWRSTKRCAPSIMRPDRSSSGQSSGAVCGSATAGGGDCADED